MLHVNENIARTDRVFPEQGRMGFLRYDMNENPEGLPKEFVDQVLSEITPEFLAVYPEPDRFLRKYADFAGVDFENVTAVNGTDTGIRYLLETFGQPGNEVVTVTPSFEMYRINCSLLGLKHVPVSYNEDLTVDIESILAAINENTCAVVLLNPNNPIGNVYSEEEASRVIARAKEVGAVVIVDEAYHYFYPNTFLNHIKTDDNVIVLRTFSKAFSLAALRLGVVIADPKLIHFVKNAKLTFDVNSVALLFGERILEHPEILEKIVKDENEGKAWLLSELAARGYETRDCRGNFVFIRTKKDAHEVAKRLEKDEKVLVHPYGNALLRDVIRVSVGSKKAMGRFLEAFLRVDG